MQKFLLNEQTKYEVLIKSLTRTLSKFNNKDYDATQSVIALLKQVITGFEELGNSIKQSEVQILLSEVTTAKAGINPINFQKQTTGRLELLNTICLKVLQQLQQILAHCYELNNEKLNQAKELVSQILTAGIQQGLITAVDIKKYKSPADAEKYCAKMTKNENIALGEKRVLLIVSRYDCLLLFDEIITSLK